MLKSNSLISRLGTVMQLAFVPRDVQGALKYWTETMGVGPFFKIQNIQTDEARYLGEKVNIEFSVYIAYWGDVQIELIEQHNHAASIYSEWIRGGYEGLHHVCIKVDDMAQARAICLEAGARVLQEIWLPGGGEAIYVDTGGGPGTMVEMICFPQESYAFFDTMKAEAQNWGGQDPVRIAG
jgi:hypothetical protein